MNFFSTHILEILIGNKILFEKLDFLFGSNALTIKSFLLKVYSRKDYSKISNIKEFIPSLLRYGLISDKEDSKEKGASSLMFANILNFELTYKCQYSCPHCLQIKYRHIEVTELSTRQIKEIIFQGHIAGLCRRGINFTGGEVLGNRDDFFEILEYVQLLNIPYRINTNSSWARTKNLNICNTLFSHPTDLVRFLKSKGLYMFAFSFDERYLSGKYDDGDLIESIRICEQEKVHYQIIFTGIKPEQIKFHVSELAKVCSINFNYLIPVTMEMVDIGMASDLNKEKYNWQTNKCSCNNKGFFRPTIIHVSPSGKVRTCIYANGLSNFGDIQKSSFVELINNFPFTRNNKVFSDSVEYSEHYKKLLKPYLNIYQPIIHDCTKNIILAKTIERYYRTDNNLVDIHFQIGKEMNKLK